MRRTRLLILLFIAIIIGSVGITYTVQRGLQERQAPPPPRSLPENVTAQAMEWRWSHDVGNFRKVEVIAKDFRQVAEPARFELRGVELRIFDEKQPDTFDRVTSAKADFDTATGILFSDGEVEITMDLPAKGQPDPAKQLMRIKSSGVRFDTKGGTIVTDRAATFSYGPSDGSAKGAEYNSVSRELRLAKDVVLNWKGEKPGDTPMQVTSGNLLYREAESKVYLAPWAKLVRGTFTLEGADSIVTLADGDIQLVEAQRAKGADRQPQRNVEYAADVLKANFTATGAIQNVAGENNARLVSTSPTAQTTVSSRRVDLEFDAAGSGALTKAVANGQSVIESKPVPQPKVPPADTRILRSDVVELAMRPGGDDVDFVQTHSPGTLEFVPNRPAQPHRTLTGERMTIKYAAANQLESFRAVKVTTRTQRPAPQGKPAPPPALTSSQDLLASFDPKTGQMAKLEQWTDFKYEEGDRRARSERAELDELKDHITLTGKARIWDSTGSTDADRIVIDQKADTMQASGNVSSTRVQEEKAQKGKPPAAAGMMSGPEPVHAKAATMTTADANNLITYQGNAVLWQGANRITADRIVIDRKAQRLEARGSVVTQLLDRRAAAPGAKTPPAAVYTTVRAPEMTYSDTERVAHYRGGVTLLRPGLTVTSQELRGWMTAAEAGKDSTLEKAFADRNVTIVQKAPDRTRTGTGEHAEYYLAEERMVLTGGNPQLVDTLKGSTRGEKLTWFARNDRLLVESAQAKPGVTNLHRR